MLVMKMLAYRYVRAVHDIGMESGGDDDDNCGDGSAPWRRALHFLEEIIVARALHFLNEIMDRHAAAPFIV